MIACHCPVKGRARLFEHMGDKFCHVIGDDVDCVPFPSANIGPRFSVRIAHPVIL